MPAGYPFAPANSVGIGTRPKADAMQKYAMLAVVLFLCQRKLVTRNRNLQDDKTELVEDSLSLGQSHRPGEYDQVRKEHDGESSP